MTRFWREGHWRWGKYSEHWVEGHWVDRDGWSSTWAYSAVNPLSTPTGTVVRVDSWVDPNARCPICGAEVFFYSNHFGSRVYFDDLGPPWPKHPCMDTSPPRTSVAVDYKPEAGRSRSGIRDLISVGLTNNIHIAGVFVVLEVAKRGPKRELTLQEIGGERIETVVSPPAPPEFSIAVSHGVELHWFDPRTGVAGRNLVWRVS